MNLNFLSLYWAQLSSWPRRGSILLLSVLPWLPLYWTPAPASTVTTMPAEASIQALPLFSDSQLQNMLQQHDIQIQQLVFQPRGLQLRFTSSWPAFHAWLKVIAKSSHELYFYQLQTREDNVNGQLTLNRNRYQPGPDVAHIESFFTSPPGPDRTDPELASCPKLPVPAIRIRAIWPQRRYVVFSEIADPATLQKIYMQQPLPGGHWHLTSINEKSIEISAQSTHLPCSQQVQLSMN